MIKKLNTSLDWSVFSVCTVSPKNHGNSVTILNLSTAAQLGCKTNLRKRCVMAMVRYTLRTILLLIGTGCQMQTPLTEHKCNPHLPSTNANPTYRAQMQTPLTEHKCNTYRAQMQTTLTEHK